MRFLKGHQCRPLYGIVRQNELRQGLDVKKRKNRVLTHSACLSTAVFDWWTLQIANSSRIWKIGPTRVESEIICCYVKSKAEMVQQQGRLPVTPILQRAGTSPRWQYTHHLSNFNTEIRWLSARWLELLCECRISCSIPRSERMRIIQSLKFSQLSNFIPYETFSSDLVWVTLYKLPTGMFLHALI